MNYKPIIGLEIHSELKTKTKMFCDSLNDPDEEKPNTNVCPICMAHPGTLPVINQEAIRKTIKTGLALGCQIAKDSKFERKNYFYPDLPKGYQISQYEQPFCTNGYLEIDGKKIRVKRVHLEEDTGRLIHEPGENYSLVDFNRAGIPLMELVTEPDITSAKEAREFAEELQLILRYLNVSEANMEKGEMRVEVNISLVPEKSANGTLGTKVEIKNLNSFRAVEKGIEFEIERQTDVLKAGKKIIQETRGWDENKGITISQREKEEAHDYRYFAEPDLPPLTISEEMIKSIKSEIPELPQSKRKRFNSEYGLDEMTIEIFINNKDLGEYFEKTISELESWLKDIGKKEIKKEEFLKIVKLCANYITTDLQGLLKGAGITDESFLITPENFAEYITLIYQGKISSKVAKQILNEMFVSGADPSHIIEDKGLTQITDQTEIEAVVKEVISKNKKAVEDFKKGKENAFQFLIGQIMAKTQGRVNPDKVKEILNRVLTKP